MFERSKDLPNRSRHHPAGDTWFDNVEDDWTKRTQMDKDPKKHQTDKDSTWTEDDIIQKNMR